MAPISEKKVEFIAKTIADVGKAMFAVGLASYFFERFPLPWRIAIGVTSFVLIIAGVLIFPDNGGGDT